MERSKGRLANDAWESLLTAHAVLIKELAADRIWDQVSMREYDVLYTLSKCDRPIRLGELNRHVLLSQPALSRMVDRLVERDLVQRTSDPTDRRSQLLSLTPTGRRQQRSVGGRHAVGVSRRMTSRLTVEEMAQLETLCQKLIDDRAEVAAQNEET